MLLRATAAAAAAATSDPTSPRVRRHHFAKTLARTSITPPSLPSVAFLRTPGSSPFPLPSSSPSSSRHFCGRAAIESPPGGAISSPSPSPSSSSPSSLHQIKPYLLSEWEPILEGWLCSAVAVYCLSRAVPKVGQLSSMLSKIGPERMVEEVLKLAALAVARSASSYLQQAFLWEAALRSAYKIRVDVFDRVLQRDLGFFEGRGSVPPGDVAYRITAETDNVADTVYALLNMTVPNMLQLTAMATQMVAASPVLSLISALVLPCMSLVIAYLGEKHRKISQKAHVSVARLSAYLNEVLPSMLAVKVNNAEFSEGSRFKKLANDYQTNLLKKRKMKALIPQILQVTYIGGILMLCAGSVVVSRGSYDASAMVSFIMSLALLVDPIQGVGKAYNEWKQGEPAIQRLFDLTRFSPQVTEKPDAVDLDTVKGDIKFCGISFRYGENMPPVLDGLNLHIKPGETVALIGPSGGGKTTITKLLLRLYDPLRGRILVDNHDIQNIKLRSLRKHICLVSQDIAMFSGTVTENIGYKDLIGKINREHVEDAARIANADEFVRTLPEGYETNIGQKGSLLSGGQKQRLAIARALYQKSSILILDEATSALDSRSEMLVRQALEHLTAYNTVLVIAHRVETVLMADRILLLDGGKVEEVSRSSFLSRDGQYDGSLLSNGLVV